MTVGDFVVRVAEVKNLAATSPDVAASSLRSAGFSLPALDLKQALTEGAVADISKSLGVRVTTSQPTAEFGSAQVDSYFSAFGSTLSTNNDPTNQQPSTDGVNGADPLEKGKGKKKGLRTPGDPI